MDLDAEAFVQPMEIPMPPKRIKRRMMMTIQPRVLMVFHRRRAG